MRPRSRGPSKCTGARWSSALALLVVLVGFTVMPAGASGVYHESGQASPSTTDSNITFDEQGLPPHTLWWVVLGGVRENSTNTSINFTEPPGSYTITAGAADGKTAWLGVPWGVPLDGSVQGSFVMPQGVPSVVVSFEPHYFFTFESNGPEPAAWGVQLSINYKWNCASSMQDCSTAPLGATNGTYGMSSWSSAPIGPFPTSFSAVVNGSGFNQILTFVGTAYPSLNLSPIEYSESGLPNGAMWNVRVNGLDQSSGTPSVVVWEGARNNSFTYSAPGSEQPFPSGGWAETDGQGYNASYGEPFEAVTFVPTNRSVYNVTFRESGLPNATHYWKLAYGPYLTSQSSTNDTVTVSVPNGTSTFSVPPESGYTATPSSGSFTVAGAAVNRVVTFTPTTYNVSFEESGLPSGTSWNVTLNGVAGASNRSTLSFSEANGKYGYTIGSVGGYVASPSSGSITVDGNPVIQAITFTRATYLVTFTESGLPSGTSWSVILNGTTQSSTTSTVSFTEPNGTYPFRVIVVPGYSVSPTSGNVTVTGRSAGESLNFAFSSKGVEGTSSGFLGLSGDTGYYLVGGVGGVVAVSVGISLLIRSRRR